MDPKLLALFRKLLALDDKTLPDSISPENFGKLVENQFGNLVKPEDFKALQQKLTEKDVDLKKLASEVETLKGGKKDKDNPELSQILETVKNLNDQIANMNRDKKIESLKKQYPDISPELLVDLPDEKIENVVSSQREVAKKHFKGADVFLQPQYDSVDAVESAINEIKANPKMSGTQKAAEVMRLNRLKTQFSAE
jgi:flagellar biosynthesis component FlhA